VPARRTDRKIEALKGVPLFDAFTKRNLALIGRIADEVDVPARKELIGEGRFGRQFFILLEGEADVRRRGRKVNTLRAGDFFGEISLLADRETTATVTTTTPARLLVITRANFNRLMREAPQAQWGVIQALVKRVPLD
jgi:CRP-like cAMP-binding protein